MLITLSGIITFVRLEQASNAHRPILVTLSGIVTLLRLVQSSNAKSPVVIDLGKLFLKKIYDANAPEKHRYFVLSFHRKKNFIAVQTLSNLNFLKEVI